MRNAVKSDIIGTFKKMYEHHDNARKFIEKKIPVNAKKCLAECKAAASGISENIAESEGESCSAVICLNEYCAYADELLANIFKETNGNKLRKQLDKLLLKAETCVKNDVKTKREVVFMPYKASMWDSLESVWKAASEDPECDVYAVPIPYYDKKSDGSFGELHYEGDGYPDYVPITHYDEYDLAARRPDIIYIHNPYDKVNTVTSVDPKFYSAELKKYTDMLVYIPYFVLSDILRSNALTLKRMEHFVLVPGVVNADRVVVQSENMRRIYIDVMLAHSDGSPEVRAFLEEKVTGLGSPKFDRVVRTSEDDSAAPEEWRKIIFREDGTRKKVVFYNTTVAAVLGYGKKWIAKLRNILDVFGRFADDIALLWRPHPLIRSTIETMRPELLEEYDKIADEYKAGNRGIYDDTPDLNRSIALSDIYFGDQSSVAELFEKVNKRVIIQNPHIRSCGPAPEEMFFEACAEANGKIYAASFFFNGLFTIDENEQTCRFVGFFPNEPADRAYMFSDAVSVNGRYIVFVPRSADNISVYDTSENEFITVNIKPFRKRGGYSPAYKFCGGVLYGDSVYLLSCTYPAIVKLSTKDWHTEYPDIWQREKPMTFTKGFCTADGSVFLPSKYSRNVMEFRLADEKIILHEIDCGVRGFWSAVCKGDEIYLTGNPQSKVVEWNRKSGEVSEYEAVGKIGNSGFSFTAGYMNGDDVFIFPFQFESMVRLNTSDKTVGKTALPFEISETQALAYMCALKQYRYFMFIGDISVPTAESDNYMLRFDTEKNEWKKLSFAVGDPQRITDEILLKSRVPDSGILLEKDSMMLFRLLESSPAAVHGEAETDADTGVKIHNKIIGEIK